MKNEEQIKQEIKALKMERARTIHNYLRAVKSAQKSAEDCLKTYNDIIADVKIDNADMEIQEEKIGELGLNSINWVGNASKDIDYYQNEAKEINARIQTLYGVLKA